MNDKNVGMWLWMWQGIITITIRRTTNVIDSTLLFINLCRFKCDQYRISSRLKSGWYGSEHTHPSIHPSIVFRLSYLSLLLSSVSKTIKRSIAIHSTTWIHFIFGIFVWFNEADKHSLVLPRFSIFPFVCTGIRNSGFGIPFSGSSGAPDTAQKKNNPKNTLSNGIIHF